MVSGDFITELVILLKAEDGTDVMITRPPPPLPHAQPYFCPPGPMPMDFRGQQWMAGGPGAGVWGGPRMMPNQFFHRGRGSQRIFYPGQARGMRMPPQNYNFNQVCIHYLCMGACM